MRKSLIPALALLPIVAVASPDVPKEAEVKQRSVAVLTVAGVS